MIKRLMTGNHNPKVFALLSLSVHAWLIVSLYLELYRPTGHGIFVEPQPLHTPMTECFSLEKTNMIRSLHTPMTGRVNFAWKQEFHGQWIRAQDPARVCHQASDMVASISSS